MEKINILLKEVEKKYGPENQRTQAIAESVKESPSVEEILNAMIAVVNYWKFLCGLPKPDQHKKTKKKCQEAMEDLLDMAKKIDLN